MGVSRFQKLPSTDHLAFADRDAQAFARFLQSPRGGAVPAENIKLLLNEEATRAAVQISLASWLKRNARTNDTIIIFLATHGAVDDQRAYLLSYDADPDDYYDTTMSSAGLAAILSVRLKNVAHVVLLLDVDRSSRAGRIGEDLAKASRGNPTLVGLAASSAKELAQESSAFGGGHGAFTYALLNGLNGEADKDKDGTVTAGELRDYLKIAVPRLTNDRQTPTEFGEFDPSLPLSYPDKPGPAALARTRFEPALIASLSPLLPQVTLRRPDPELVLQGGHSTSITAVAFSPNGRWLASGSQDGGVKIWEAASGRELRTLPGHDQPVTALQFSPDGRWLATASEDRTVKIWDVNNSRQIRSLEGHSAIVTSVAFSPDGQLLASGGRDHTARIWEVRTGKELHVLDKHGKDVRSLAFSADNKRLATGSLDTLVKIWDTSSGREIATLQGLTDPVAALSVLDQGIVLSLSERGTVKRWDSATGQDARSIPGEADSIIAAAISPDGSRLAWANLDFEIKLQDLNAGKVTLFYAGKSDITSLAFSADSTSIAWGTADNNIRIREIGSAREIACSSNTDAMAAVAFSPDGRWLATRSSDLSVKLWDLKAERTTMIRVGEPGPPRANGAPPPRIGSTVAFSSDGWLAWGAPDKSIRVMEVATGNQMQPLISRRGNLTSAARTLAFHPNGRMLTAGAGDNTVTIWDLGRRSEPRKREEHTDAVTAVVYSPDQQWLATGSLDQTIIIRDPESGLPVKTLQSMQEDGVTALAFSPDSRWLASGGADNTVKIWEAASWSLKQTFKAHDASITSVSFSSDGKWLAAASWDRTVHVWEVTSWKEGEILSGHSGPVTALAFSPNGRLLATASWDGSARLWDPARGEERALLASTRDGEDWVAVTRKGSFDGSENGLQKLVSWRLSNQVYALDTHFEDYYTPRLVPRILAGERPQPKVALSDRNLAPDIRIVSPTLGAQLKDDTAILQVQVTDQGGGVGDVRLYHNGTLVESNKVDGAGAYKFEVNLVPGTNRFSARAFSKDLALASDDQSWFRLTAQGARGPRLHVLVVGIDQYVEPSLTLQYARKDGSAIPQYFSQHAKLRVKDVHVTELYDRKATKANILTEIDSLSRDARPEDVVLVYMAGHGVGVGQQYYFLGQEMRNEPDSTAAIQKYGISASALSNALIPNKALKQVLILDTCGAEAALSILARDGATREFPDSEIQTAKKLSEAKGRFFVAASTKKQYAVEVPELGHSVFASALLAGLGEKAPPKAFTNDGSVTILSLLQYLDTEVPRLTEKYHDGHRQNVVTNINGQDFPVAVP